MIPTIETICEDLAAGKITVRQAISWLHEHAQGTANELRDMFAATALQGELACQDVRSDGKGTGVITEDGMDEFSKRIWRMADAMVRNRSDAASNTSQQEK